MWLGAHIGIADGLANAVVTGRSIGCEAIQIFAKSPQMWKGPPIPGEAANEFRTAVRSEGLKATAVHHGYLLNLANPKESLLTQSRAALLDELARAEALGVDHLILHPGAHLGAGVPTGLARIAESLNWAFDEVPESSVRVLLENAAGQGTTLGSSFSELAEILGAVRARDRIGVALDTCHLFASGREFRTPETYGRMIDDLDRELGSKEVRAFHLNDARADLGSHLDRHENIGQGLLGTAGFVELVNDARWAHVAGYLETPLDDRGYDRYERDLTTLRSLLRSSGSKPAAPAKRRRKSSGGPTPK